VTKTDSVYFAHSPNRSEGTDPLWLHLRHVAERASKYAEIFGAEEEAKLAGMLHDLGKYGSRFQDRLRNPQKVRGIDHWSAGAWTALERYGQHGVAAALAIQGHHIGLQKADGDSLRDLNLSKLSHNHPLQLRLSEKDADTGTLIQRLQSDGLELPKKSERSVYDYAKVSAMPAAVMLDVRMLYSTLVDADFIETDAHFKASQKGAKCYRKPGQSLKPEQALPILKSYLGTLGQETAATEHIRRLREDLLDACLACASSAPGLFTLTAPTGSGKTLSMLAFALKHAQEHDLRRIVLVIPYLSIIEQTVEVYRRVFAEHFAKYYVLEDHSLAGTHAEDPGQSAKDQDTIDEARRRRNLLAENWDAPLIVTTSVQLLESIFANRPSACRKLHRLAGSVILFDEVQTLPVNLIIPTLATLSRLAERYGSTVVFSTATQPAFSHLHGHVAKFCAGGWQPREIVPSELDLFGRARRTKVIWPETKSSDRISWSALAERMLKYKQVLCIVNLKRHALALYDELAKSASDGLYHLSTNMCPAHRRDVLARVHERLKNRWPCRLVSTQCVEAGVDIDFPVVYRALGPLDAIAQAAGRCNRNGLAETGSVIVFVPDDDKQYPGGVYRQAADITQILLAKGGADRTDINNLQFFVDYYSDLYSLSRPEGQNPELAEAVQAQDFIDVAKRYRVIDKNAINIVVPYLPSIFDQLKTKAADNGLTRGLICMSRPYTIGIFRPGRDDPIRNYLELIRVGKKPVSDDTDWFVYLCAEHYDPHKGLVPPSMDCLIA